MKTVLVLGSTGSIGINALKVMEELKGSHRLVGLSCHANNTLLVEQARRLAPRAVGVGFSEKAGAVRQALDGRGVEILDGPGAHADLIDLLDPDIVLVAVTGSAGLLPSMRTVERGKRLALANKESLVMAGHLLLPAAASRGAEIIPVDSEHSAVFQALRGEDASALERIILTASGGPLVDLPLEALREVAPEDALKHPTWNMGRKITIDSATMMNKALEIVEARWLFDVPVEKIEVVVHRQSVLHGMAAFTDGSIIAQMGVPDMKVPIRFAFTYPARSPSERPPFDFSSYPILTFEPPDLLRFPAIQLGYRAAQEEGLAGTVLNAANEVAVDFFLNGAISFPDITHNVARVMNAFKNMETPALEEILAADRWAREETAKCISQ